MPNHGKIRSKSAIFALFWHHASNTPIRLRILKSCGFGGMTTGAARGGWGVLAGAGLLGVALGLVEVVNEETTGAGAGAGEETGRLAGTGGMSELP